MLRTIAKALGRSERAKHSDDPPAKAVAGDAAPASAPLAPAAEAVRRQPGRHPYPKARDSTHVTFEARRRALRKAGRREVPANELEMPDAREQAVALLSWLQGEGGRTGEIFAFELAEMLVDLCAERMWQPHPWNAVARELNRLLKAPKRYRWVGPEGKRVHKLRLYRIPPARVMPVTRMAA